MPHTTLIISDTHLGQPGRATADALRPLWQGVDELIINGDVAEVQVPWLRGSAVREVDKLDELTRRDGVRLTLISGNHDAYLTDRRYVQLAGGQVLVMHGDALHPAVAPWGKCAKTMVRLTQRAIADADQDDLHNRLSVAQHVGHSEFLEEHVLSSRGENSIWRALARPWEVPQVLWYWLREPDRAAAFLERYAPQARTLILGHSHHGGIWRRRGRTIINTGAFMFPGRPLCAILRGNTLGVQRIIKRADGYQFCRKPVVTIEDDSLLEPSTEAQGPQHRAA